MSAPEVDVLVVGAGPAGLMLASELALAGIRTQVIDQEPALSDVSRGFSLNARSLELLDRRGLAGRFLREGPTVQAASFAGLGTPLDLSTMDTDHPYALGIAQARVQELLAERVAELEVPIRYGHRLRGLRQDDTGVTAEVEAGAELRARYLVGCDGAHSTVRKAAGIAFPGVPSTRYALVGDVVAAVPDELPFGPTVTPRGSVFAIPRPGYVRLITADPDAGRATPVTLAALQDAVDRVLGRHLALSAPRWLSRFGDGARLAETFVAGRVLLAGDAAHTHPPAGAVGVNVALDDAVNLGWKLAATVHGHAPDGLLGTYHAERHATGERLLRNARAQALLGEADARTAPLRELLLELAALPAANTYLAELVTGISTRYPMPHVAPHPLVGRMVPNWTLDCGTSMSDLLADGRGVLLDLGGTPATVDTSARLRRYTGSCLDLDLPGVLVRPDGHVAWAGGEGLDAALATWF